MAKIVAQRIALLPLPRVAKLETCRATVLSRAAYGWTGKGPTKELSKALGQAVHKACGGFRQSPPALRRLLEGGHYCFRASCGNTTTGVVAQANGAR